MRTLHGAACVTGAGTVGCQGQTDGDMSPRWVGWSVTRERSFWSGGFLLHLFAGMSAGFSVCVVIRTYMKKICDCNGEVKANSLSRLLLYVPEAVMIKGTAL